MVTKTIVILRYLTSAEHEVDRIKQPGQGPSQVGVLKLAGIQTTWLPGLSRVTRTKSNHKKDLAGALRRVTNGDWTEQTIAKTRGMKKIKLI